MTTTVFRAFGTSPNETTTKLTEEIVEKGARGFSRALVPYVGEDTQTALVSVKTGVGSGGVGWGLNLKGIDTPLIGDYINPMVRHLFGSVLAQVRVPMPQSLDHWLTASADNTRGGFEPSTHPGDMMCTILPIVDNKPSPRFNRVFEEEFIHDVNGDVNYNDTWWSGQKVFKNQKNNNKLVLMDVCATIPEFLLTTNQKAPHREAMKWLNEFGCGIGGNFYKLTLYKGYVAVFMSFMQSPMVKKARLYGFYPLILIKNCLLSNSTWGIRGMQFVTIDKDAKTCLLLAGFWRMTDNDPNKLEVVAVNADGSLLTHASVFD